MKKYTFIILVAFGSLSFSLHKHYISLCEVEYVQEKKALQVILSVFTDDIQNAIAQEISADFEINEKDKNMDNTLFLYLKKHLKFEVNATLKNYTYIGKEIKDNKIFFYLEVTDIPQLYTLNITNTLLLNQFQSQKNIVKIKIGNRHKSFYLNKSKTVASFKF